MLPIYLRDGDSVVFWLSLIFMIATLAVRVLTCVRYYTTGLVKPNKLLRFLWASCVFILEPNAGSMYLGPLVTEKADKVAHGLIRSTHSLRHDHDKLAMKSTLDSACLTLLTEDLPELVILFIYFFQHGTEVNPFFFFSLGTTIIHALRQLFEIYHTRQFRDVNTFLRAHIRTSFKGSAPTWTRLNSPAAETLPALSSRPIRDPYNNEEDKRPSGNPAPGKSATVQFGSGRLRPKSEPPYDFQGQT